MELPFTELRKDKDQVGFERTVLGNQKGKNQECDFDMLIGGTFQMTKWKNNKCAFIYIFTNLCKYLIK